jgi:hypothetical protein
MAGVSALLTGLGMLVAPLGLGSLAQNSPPGLVLGGALGGVAAVIFGVKGTRAGGRDVAFGVLGIATGVLVTWWSMDRFAWLMVNGSP